MLENKKMIKYWKVPDFALYPSRLYRGRSVAPWQQWSFVGVKSVREIGLCLKIWTGSARSAHLLALADNSQQPV